MMNEVIKRYLEGAGYKINSSVDGVFRTSKDGENISVRAEEEKDEKGNLRVKRVIAVIENGGYVTRQTIGAVYEKANHL